MSNVIRQRRTCLVLSSILVLCVVFHPFLLRFATTAVIRPDESFDTATHLLVLRSARTSNSAFDFAAGFSRLGPERRVLVMKDYVRRAEAMGAESPFLEDTIAMLIERGVPRTQIEVIGDGYVMTTSEQLRLASGWLEKQSTPVNLQVATTRFNTGFIAEAAKTAVPSVVRPRIHFLGFDRGGINRSNWWKSARGLKEFIRANLRLIHLRIFGESRPDIDWDPDEYEQSLLARKQNA